MYPKSPALRPETLAIHAGRQPDPATGAVVTPIHLSSTFQRDADGSYPHGYSYSRANNPNRQALEACLTQLEGGDVGVAFASGVAATMAVLQTLKAGDHVILPQDAYHGTRHLLRDLFQRWTLSTTVVDMRDPSVVKAALQPNTRLIWVETPSNPMLQLVDIAAIAAIAHSVGALCACDNTWATPLLQKPLELGADLVVHSTTKYLGGHSDVLGGAVIVGDNPELAQSLRQIQMAGGAVPSPFDCWLVLRGIQTMPYRMRGHCDNAGQVAQFLAQHPQVSAVHYPGLPQHPQYQLAQQQMQGFGGMVSAQIKGGAGAAFRMLAHLTIFTRATSLGGVESLIEHRASTEGPGSLTPDDLVRISVGLEHPQDLIDDLAQALAHLEGAGKLD
jgi:cystathionine gamma-synthase